MIGSRLLRDGEYINTCAVADVDNDRLVEMMVGRRIEQNFPPKATICQTSEPIIELEEIQLKNGPVSSFQLHKGEILGFAGLVGSGRTETALAILGAHLPSNAK